MNSSASNNGAGLGKNRSIEPPDSGDRFAAALRGFGFIGIIAIAVILSGNLILLPLSAVLVLVWRWLSHTPWRDIGFVRPKSWARTILLGLVFGVSLKFFMKAIVMPLLGADPINWAYHWLAGNAGALPAMLVYVILAAGAGEEILFRGYMFERLGKLLGTGLVAKVFIVLVTTAWFGWAHYSEQGIAGVQQATIVGFTFATIFAVTRQLWFLMIAHAAFDVTAVIMIYLDAEPAVAHLIFK